MDAHQTRFDRILIPLDGSPIAEQALPYVQTIARSDTEVILLRVMPEPQAMYDLHSHLVVAADEGRRRLQEFARRDLYHAADRLRASVMGACVQAVVAYGDPAEEILRAATDLGVGLIVMASEGQGTTGRFALGSVADRVARTSPVPVLVIRDRVARARDVPTPVQRIVVPLDGSDRAMQALVVAEDLAKRLHLPVLLLTVVDVAASGPPALIYEAEHDQALYRELMADVIMDAQRTLDRAGARLILRGICVDSRLLAGPTAGTIMDATGPGDVIVMTSRGRGGTKRWPIGSVAEKVISSGPVPVVLVPTKREPDLIAPVVDDIFQREPIGVM
jgi:nucleotide-binding universal stress UspA family protein